MTKFIPKEKLSKKARKELAKQRRTLWQYSPVTKKIESKKLYNRKRNSHERFDERGMGVLFVFDLPGIGDGQTQRFGV